MRTILSRLALITVLGPAAPALLVHGQQNPEAMPRAGLVRLLDEDKVAFGVTVDARADPVALSANDDIDFVFFDMEHGPYDVSALRTWTQWLVNPAAVAVTGDAMAGKAVIVRIPAPGRLRGPMPGSRRGTGACRFRTTSSGRTAGGWIGRTATCCPGSSSRARSGWPTCARSPASSASATARRVSSIGAVLFAGFETGRDMLSMHGGSLETVAQATNTVLDAGQEFGLPVAMTSAVRSAAVGDAASALVRHLPRRMRSDGLETVNVRTSRGTTNMMERIEQGARLFTGGVAPALRRERGVRRPARSAGQRPAAAPARQPLPYRLEGTEAPHPVRRRRRRATVSDVGPDHRRHAPGTGGGRS